MDVTTEVRQVNHLRAALEKKEYKAKTADDCGKSASAALASAGSKGTNSRWFGTGCSHRVTHITSTRVH